MAVARPSGSVQAYPREEDLTVFEIPHGCFVKMHEGTWHAGVRGGRMHGVTCTRGRGMLVGMGDACMGDRTVVGLDSSVASECVAVGGGEVFQGTSQPLPNKRVSEY